MAELIGVVGNSGSGKSTSLRNLNPESTFIINVAGKSLPAKGSMKKYPLGIKPSEGGRHLISKNAGQIAQVVQYISENRSDIKNIVIDDAGYVQGFDVMDNAKKKGYDKWTDNALNFMLIIDAAKAARHDLRVIFLFHTEVGKDDRLKIKTTGAMLDNVIYLDGLFTVNLEAKVLREGDETKFVFDTQADPYSTRKSPAGMFPSEHIPNDLGYVVNQLEKYYYED